MESSIVYVVEDDHFQADYLLRLLQREFGTALNPKLISTCLEFLERFEEIAESKPAAIVLDVMLQWTDKKVSKRPEDPQSFERAGMECRRKMIADPRTREVPILIYSVLDRADLGDSAKGASFIRKDASNGRVTAWIRAALKAAKV